MQVTSYILVNFLNILLVFIVIVNRLSKLLVVVQCRQFLAEDEVVLSVLLLLLFSLFVTLDNQATLKCDFFGELAVYRIRLIR